ncbi:HpcH/HpaI aldolase family protein [Candidatus Pelagibacter sp.]|uniref:HpcH/HpaI aldolase family protein n=1 Tax=Candidatus Pelagibacter sp. TaxID=2024849 RepID=UPI003F850550
MNNIFKEKLRNNQFQLGLWSLLCSNLSADIIGGSGFDWIVLDMEHAPNDVKTIISQTQAIESKGQSAVLIRIPWNDPSYVKQLLDCGLNTLIVPMINNKEDAEKAVKACFYPPKGIRGVASNHRGDDYGRKINYLKEIEDQICLIPQLETQEAMKNCISIATTEGVSAVFIGPADLSADMNILADFENKGLWLLIEKTLKKLKSENIPVGTIIGKPNLVQRCIDLGFDFVGCGTDSALLAKAADELKNSFKVKI